MFETDADQALTVNDHNHTVLVSSKRDPGMRNLTDELYPLPDYVNVTLLDMNATEEIDSFYFYEVSPRVEFSCVSLGDVPSRKTICVSRDIQRIVQLSFSDF